MRVALYSIAEPAPLKLEVVVVAERVSVFHWTEEEEKIRLKIECLR